MSSKTTVNKILTKCTPYIRCISVSTGKFKIFHHFEQILIIHELRYIYGHVLIMLLMLADLCTVIMLECTLTMLVTMLECTLTKRKWIYRIGVFFLFNMKVDGVEQIIMILIILQLEFPRMRSLFTSAMPCS